MSGGTRFGAGGPWAEHLALPRDREGFVRRECPACHRTFKIVGTPRDGLLLLSRVSARVTHANAEELASPLATRVCPYCRRRAPEDRWLTAEQRAFFEQRAEVFAQELRYERLSYVERTLSANPNVTFVKLKPEPRPQRLRSERDDLTSFPLYCCVEELKISCHWPGPIFCHFCGFEHPLGGPRVRERVQAFLQRGSGPLL